MRDELRSKKVSSDECLVMNIDHSSNDRTHWTCLLIKNGVSFYFDSYGFEPTLEVLEYCKEPRYYSSFPKQKVNQVICGHYCIYVLYKLSNGAKFYDVCDELYKFNFK